MEIRAGEDIQPAITVLRQILELEERVYGENSEEVAITLKESALIHQELGDIDAARRFLKRRVAIHESLHGKKSWQVKDGLRMLKWNQNPHTNGKELATQLRTVRTFLETGGSLEEQERFTAARLHFE